MKIMTEVTLQVPDTLYYRLDRLAQEEGVALNQYILYVLTRQVTTGDVIKRVSPEEIKKQEAEYMALRSRWRALAVDKDVDQILAEREIAEPEPELTPELIAKVQARIAAAREQKEKLVKESA